MQAVLVMFRPEGVRRSFSVHKELTVIGRREDCDLRIPLGEISRKHCRIVRDGDALRVEDLGSSNGTYLNGERVQEATLTAGDTLQVGSVLFVLQVDGVPAEEDMSPIDRRTAQPVAEGDGALSNGSSVGSTAQEIGEEPRTLVDDGGDGAFDPMAILDSNESAVDGSMVIDLEESQHDQAV